DNQTKLSQQQERALVSYINKLSQRGIPPTSKLTRNLAENIAKTTVGKNWLSRFIKRHHTELDSLYLTSFELSRKRADNYQHLSLYFDLVSQPIFVVSSLILI
ncbi:hypothetical protein EV356DRAFT_458460, partial [Viridothelium virens]